MDVESSDSSAASDVEQPRLNWARQARLALGAGALAAVVLMVFHSLGSGASQLRMHDLQHLVSEAAACGPAPQLNGEAVDDAIHGSTDAKGILILANPEMRCTKAVVSALQSKGMAYTLKEFQTTFEYKPGASVVWDWLHCSYPDDKLATGAIMHSYVFSGGRFEGQGFAAADKVQKGLLSGPTGGPTCEERFAEEADVLKQYQANTSSKVLLFGWLACPCTGMAQTRFAEHSVCYEGRTWANPSSRLMAYLQCKEGKPEDHSFVYFRGAQGDWDFAGNGFLFDDGAMPEERFESLVSASGAATNCRHANVKVNVFGTALEECRANPDDMSGSWQDDGTCSEQIGGIHEICIERLPADFSSETHQPPWSKDRANQRHCVCVGAWSLYMTDAAKHPQNAAAIMPHCRAIPETALTSRYLHNWKDWNGYPANVVEGVGKLVERCLSQVTETKMQCGLRRRFQALSEEVPDLAGPSLQKLQARLVRLDCP